MNTSKNHCFLFKPAIESQQALIHEWLQQDYTRTWIHGIGLKTP